jgi:hypothetical protein
MEMTDKEYGLKKIHESLDNYEMDEVEWSDFIENQNENIISQLDKLEVEKKLLTQVSNRLDAFDQRAIQIFTDGEHICVLKLYIGNNEVSIAFQKVTVDSIYGNEAWIPFRTIQIRYYKDNIVDESLTIDTTDDLISLLNKLSG